VGDCRAPPNRARLRVYVLKINTVHDVQPYVHIHNIFTTGKEKKLKRETFAWYKHARAPRLLAQKEKDLPHGKNGLPLERTLKKP
jgi:hypothetical protein